MSHVVGGAASRGGGSPSCWWVRWGVRLSCWGVMVGSLKYFTSNIEICVLFERENSPRAISDHKNENETKNIPNLFRDSPFNGKFHFKFPFSFSEDLPNERCSI